MAQRLKRWESPRKEGRNSKGKGGSARQRQKKKQMKMMRQKLRESGKNPEADDNGTGNNKQGENTGSLLFVLGFTPVRLESGFVRRGGDRPEKFPHLLDRLLS
jgi:hypothetical protein